jgi:hypothetical protein
VSEPVPQVAGAEAEGVTTGEVKKLRRKTKVSA